MLIYICLFVCLFILLFKMLQLFPLFSPSPLLPRLTLSPPRGNLRIVVLFLGTTMLCINVLWLISSPSFIQFPPPSPFLVAVSLFYEHMLLLLSSSLVYCVHQISHISEIIWYFSFTDWLNSLSMIFSRSIHAATKCKSLLFSAA